eukprot:CAMPEP_0119308298 /NCGR_PEP_ID=MMETSP1333-20130426/9922_1 /TAXON_ID=418940 /ORGANISM="Scyphosphaera apsteinii, Strain RCC1455" /LENGTH=66 /DNA_ID=CAMNT_0007312031 /DNA_START=603 /DNA_END=803 /DNA_ORIENTATION=+
MRMSPNSDPFSVMKTLGPTPGWKSSSIHFGRPRSAKGEASGEASATAWTVAASAAAGDDMPANNGD